MKAIKILLLLMSSNVLLAQVSTIQTTAIYLGDNTEDIQNATIPDVSITYKIPVHKDYNNLVDEIKIQKNLTKLSNLGYSTRPRPKTRSTTPVVVSGYNIATTSGTPPDNSIACNTQGQVVSMINSSIRMYNLSGTPISNLVAMSTFFKTSAIPGQNTTFTNTMCDPKVIFDCEAKRFFVFGMTCEPDYLKSYLLIAVSKEEDPTKGFNTYAVYADKFNQGVWFDHPRIGYNGADLFVSGNMFTNSGQFKDAYVYQMDKIAAMSGNAAPKVVVYANLPGKPFTLTFANSGNCTNMGTTMIALGNDNPSMFNPGPFSTFDMYTFNGKASDAVPPTATYNSITTNYVYAVPGDAAQKGSSILLKTGDTRGQEAININGTIHYVFHTDVGSGYNGIYYAKMYKNSAGSWVCKGKTIGNPGEEHAFPSIAPAAVPIINGWGQSMFITCVAAGDNEYPSIKAFYIDDYENNSSALIVKNGLSFVDYGPLNTTNSQGFTTTRWGDYIGIARCYNTNPGQAQAILSSHHSNLTNKWTNYNALISANAPIGLEPQELSEHSVINYPNPNTGDEWNMIITADKESEARFELYSLEGKLVKRLLDAPLKNGSNHFTMRTDNLSSGTYFVHVYTEDKIIAREKLIITR